MGIKLLYLLFKGKNYLFSKIKINNKALNSDNHETYTNLSCFRNKIRKKIIFFNIWGPIGGIFIFQKMVKTVIFSNFEGSLQKIAA